MRTPSFHRRGFSLVEVTLALGVAGFCLVTVMGLLPLGLNSNQNSIEQTLAASVASQVYSDLRATPCTASATATSRVYQIAIPSPGTSGTTGQFTVTADGQLKAVSSTSDPTNPARFQVNVWVTPPSQPSVASGATPIVLPPGQSTMVRILVTWPPLATPANAAGAFEAIDSLARG